MIRWGIVGNSHDASMAVFKNDVCVWAALAKDFSNIDHDPDLNNDIINMALRIAPKPDEVVWYERPLLKTFRQWRAGQGWLAKENNIKKYLSQWNISAPIRYTQHHHSHAAYAYYTQPHDNCAVVCLDSIGEFETLTVWHGKDNNLKKIYSQGYPHSLGLFYSAMTQRVGLVPQRDEYLISQWAKKGDKLKYYSHIKRDLLGSKLGVYFFTKENLHRGCRWWRPDLTSEQDMYDIAASTQYIFEQALRDICGMAFRETDANHLALAGGGALNKDGVDKIKEDWLGVWVPPNPGDPGSCIGAVLAHTKEKIELDSVWHKKV